MSESPFVPEAKSDRKLSFVARYFITFCFMMIPEVSGAPKMDINVYTFLRKNNSTRIVTN